MFPLISTIAIPTAETQVYAMVAYLRSAVVANGGSTERFHAVFLDAQNTYLDDHSLGVGRQAALTLRMRELFSRALAVGASGLIIAHNHPSGDCRPSEWDITSTKRLQGIAQALDIQLIDHLIITATSAYSMRAAGNL